MEEIPIFPLNTVLFPGAPLQLHIFEERYKRMIGFCLEQRKPFGLVLIRSGQEALAPLAEPFLVGCTAKITQVQRLDEGRMNILSIGQDRFRVVSLDKESQPYLVGTIESFPLTISNNVLFQSEILNLREKVDRYLRLVTESSQGKFEANQIPQEPFALAYLAASLLQIPLQEKQALLEIESAEELAAEEIKCYRREIAILKAVISSDVPVKGAFSRN